jgi:hypothetical protein
MLIILSLQASKRSNNSNAIIESTLCERVEMKISCFLLWLIPRTKMSNANCLFAALLGEKDGVNVWKNTSSCDGNSTQQLVQFFIILDGKSNVTGHNTTLLVITGSVSSKLENLSAQVLQDSRKVDGGTGSHTGGVLSLTEVTSDTTNRELKSCLGRRSGGLLFSSASFSFSYRLINGLQGVRVRRTREILKVQEGWIRKNVPDMMLV